MAKFRDMSPGTKVRLSGKFLRNTGQLTSAESRRVWTVLDAPTLPHWVVVDEEIVDLVQRFTLEEIKADPSLRWRRIAKANLVVVGQRDSRDCP